MSENDVAHVSMGPRCQVFELQHALICIMLIRTS